MAAVPKFGGTNGVPELDIGQTGSTRRAGNTHKATVQVLVESPDATKIDTELPQEHVVFEDNLGQAGQQVVWRCILRASSQANFNILLGELAAYKTGYNTWLGAAYPIHTKPTEMVAHGWTYADATLADFRVRGRRFKRADGWYVQECDLIFKVLSNG